LLELSRHSHQPLDVPFALVSHTLRAPLPALSGACPPPPLERCFGGVPSCRAADSHLSSQSDLRNLGLPGVWFASNFSSRPFPGPHQRGGSSPHCFSLCVRVVRIHRTLEAVLHEGLCVAAVVVVETERVPGARLECSHGSLLLCCVWATSRGACGP
jgi:hypothetical protein